MVDCISTNGEIPELPGIHVREQDDNRWRFMLDTTSDALERLKAQGITSITTSPVTLEELFIALVKED